MEISGSQRAEEIKTELISDFSQTSKIKSWLGPENMLFWPSKISRIPDSLFWLSNISLEKNWSQKKVIVQVKERQPWLLWCLSSNSGSVSAPDSIVSQASSSLVSSSSSTEENSAAGSLCYWLDNQGIVFSLAPDVEGFLVPKMLETNGRQQFSLGQPVYQNPKFLENTLEIINQIENSAVLPASRFLIENASLQELKAETTGPELYFSLNFPPPDINKILSGLSGTLNFKKINYVDFRVENRIYYK